MQSRGCYHPPRFSAATSAIRKIFFLFYALHHAGFALSFVPPTIGIQFVVRQHTNMASNVYMETSQYRTARKPVAFNHRVNVAQKSVLLLFGKKTNIENDEQQDENETKNLSVLKRLGNKVISTIRRSNETLSDENLDGENKDESLQKGWFTRAKERDSDEIKDEGDEKTTGVFGMVVNTLKLKRQSNNTDIEERDSSVETDVEPRAVSPFRKPNLTDPFESELALASELKRQKALDRYVSGETEQTPPEFLPQTSEDDSLGIDQALNTLDKSVSFIRGKMKEIRLNKNDEDNKFFLTPTEEEKRLDKIRKDLENRRKQLLVQDQKQKSKKISKDGKQLKLGATETSKRGKKDQYTANEKKTETNEIDMKEKPDIQKGWTGVIVDGVVSGAASAIGNAWQRVRSTATKSSDEEWIPVCPKTRVSPGEIYPVVAGGLDLLVIGSKDGTKVFCVPNSCPHLGTPLETGMVERRPCPKPYGPKKISNSLSTNDNTKMAVDDGFEECIVCPLHRTAFSLDTGEVRGEWCPYPPVIGKVMGTVKTQNNLTTFKMRTRGKYLEIKITSELDDE
jgi:Ferredoxin subunits of nitrite reductase and ring-hydroxylating dioxygenases